MYRRKKTTEIIVHCSATPEGRDYSISTIRNWHLHRKPPFEDIGYHYVIGLDGIVYPGRDEKLAGAHCVGHNPISIGICYIGGLEAKPDSNGKYKAKDTRTEAQKEALVKLIKFLKKKYPTIAKVLGHRDTYEDKNHNGKVDPWEWGKECPSFDAIEEYKDI